MITIRSNASTVLSSVLARVRRLGDTDQLMQTIAQNMLGTVKSRIHEKGLAADGKPIGEYSPSYMKLRTKGYKSDKITRGKKKGEPRTIKKFNRTSDKKVIISLTRQMELDWSIIPTGRGYGLGYKNQENAKKVGYVEKTYNRPIFKLTLEEHQKCIDTAIEYKNNLLNG